MNTLVLDSIAFDNFKTVNEDKLSIVEGGIMDLDLQLHILVSGVLHLEQ